MSRWVIPARIGYGRRRFYDSIIEKEIKGDDSFLVIAIIIFGGLSEKIGFISMKTEAEASVLSASQFVEKLNSFKASYKQNEYFNRANLKAMLI